MTLLKVKDLLPDDQPRERAKKYGIASLSTPDLLALILRTGIPGNPITSMCRQIMSDNGNSLRRLMRRTREELMLTPGIGELKALQIEAIMELIKRYADEIPDDFRISTSADVHHLMKEQIGNLDHEEIWLLCLDRANRVTSRHRITSGTATASLFDAKMILKKALLDNAESVIMCHNHPSGILKPSPSDDEITHKLRNACNAINLRLLDHIIITASGCYSFADNGNL